jgi:hypothetical protein
MAEKEYIEREKLNDMLEDFCVNESFYDALQTIPAADVAPVRHGHWTKSKCSVCGDYEFRCSSCGETFWEGDNYATRAHFCSNCGAKMDEQ